MILQFDIYTSAIFCKILQLWEGGRCHLPLNTGLAETDTLQPIFQYLNTATLQMIFNTWNSILLRQLIINNSQYWIKLPTTIDHARMKTYYAPWGVLWEILSMGMIFPNILPADRVCIGSMKILSSNIIPVAREYQEIHPYSAMNSDNIRINVSLTMTRLWGRELLSELIKVDWY